MHYKDPVNGVSYEIPGKSDWEILLDPALLLFMHNVDDPTVPEAEGYTVYPSKKSKSRLGIWYSKEEPDNSPRVRHAVRILPALRQSSIMPGNENTGVVYPVPLYHGTEYSATLLLFVSQGAIFYASHGVIEDSDINSLSEQFLEEFASHDPNVQSLKWVRDLRNTSVCSLPQNTMDFSNDLLVTILRGSSVKDQIFTQEEINTKILQKKKFLTYFLIAAVFLGGVSYAINYIRDNDAKKLAALRTKEVDLNTAMRIQKSEYDSFKFLVHSLTQQPDYTDGLLRLYAGTMGLTHRHFRLELQTLSGTPKMLYYVTGTSGERMEDIRPALKTWLAQAGFSPRSVDLVPTTNLQPTIRVSGEASLGQKE